MNESRGYDWEEEFNHELDMAQQARNQGNEGRARVCARRMVGLLLAEFFNRHKVNLTGMNALDYIRYAVNSPLLSENLRATLQHFLIKVDEDFNLPGHIDLLAEALWLKEKLFEKA